MQRASPISSDQRTRSLHHNYRLNSTSIASTRLRVCAMPSGRNKLIASFAERYFFTSSSRRGCHFRESHGFSYLFVTHIRPSSNRGCMMIHSAADTTLGYARILIDHTSTGDCPSNYYSCESSRKEGSTVRQTSDEYVS